MVRSCWPFMENGDFQSALQYYKERQGRTTFNLFAECDLKVTGTMGGGEVCHQICGAITEIENLRTRKYWFSTRWPNKDSVVEDIFRQRQPLPSLDAIYFMHPTKENKAFWKK